MTGQKRKPRPPIKLMTKAEQEAAAAKREAARLGRVASHYGKSVDACPYPEGDPPRQEWLTGLRTARNKKLRLDMSPARAKGHAAFHDDLTLNECPLDSRSPEHAEWHEGWEDARKRKEKDDERFR